MATSVQSTNLRHGISTIFRRFANIGTLCVLEKELVLKGFIKNMDNKEYFEKNVNDSDQRDCIRDVLEIAAAFASMRIGDSSH